MLPEPDAIVEAIRESRRREARPLNVFWVRVGADRDGFAGDLEGESTTLAVVSHVLRTVRFVDPNSVMQDVAEILNCVRDEIQNLADVAREQKGVDLVVISRKELRLADTSSPIVLPDWFPVAAGQQATVRIEDLTWTASVALSDQATALDDLRRLLHEVDKALLLRLRASRQRDHRKTQALLELVFDDAVKPGALDEELDRIGRTLNEVRNPTSYRPSVSHDPTVVGRLWAHSSQTAPDKLPKAAKALARALGEGSLGDRPSLAAVLQRPPPRVLDASDQWCFELIVTLRTACQLATAAAHADDYPSFPAILLRATSNDLCRFLDNAVAKLGEVTAP